MKRIYVMICFALLLALSFKSSAFAESKKDIVDTAVAAGDFKTLAAALQAAGLVDTLKGPARSQFSRQQMRHLQSCRLEQSKTC